MKRKRKKEKEGRIDKGRYNTLTKKQIINRKKEDRGRKKRREREREKGRNEEKEGEREKESC